jgi:hypothetical protein
VILPTLGAYADGVKRSQLVGQGHDGVNQLIGCIRRGLACLGDDVSVVVDDNAQQFGAAELNSGCEHAFQASALALSSSRVDKMRTSARRFTKPGMGTTSSIDRLYATSHESVPVGVNT